MNQDRLAVIVGVLSALAGGCGLGRSGSVKTLAEYEVKASAHDETSMQVVNRTISFGFLSSAEDSSPARCASLGGATVTFNGRRLEGDEINEGGWGPSKDFYKSADECETPFVWIRLPREGVVPADAVLEIAGEGVRFRVVVPNLVRQQEMDVVSVGSQELVVQPRPALLGRPVAFLKRPPRSPELLPSEVVGQAIRIDVGPVAPGEQTIQVQARDDMSVAECEGFRACSASVSSARDLAVRLPPR